MIEYDSTTDTLLHIKRVQELMAKACVELLKRSERHDASKLLPPEKELFDTYTPKLKDTTYGSKEYTQFLEELKPAIRSSL